VWERGVSLIPSSSHEWPRWSPDSILIDGHACSLQKKETKRQSKPVVHHACIRRMMLRLRSSLVDAQKGGYQYGVEVVRGFQILTPQSQRLGKRPHAYTNDHRQRCNFICPLPRTLIQRFVDVISDFGHKLGVQVCYFALNISRHICFQESYCVHRSVHYIIVPSPIRSHHRFIS
jgi:hypothetical protein